MKGRLWKIIVVSLAVVATITCAALFFPKSQDMRSKVEGSNMFTLIKPPFISAAEEGSNFLEEEAGISAYTNVGEEINLAKAKTGFRTIEKETNEYIIGSVALPGYAGTEDVHCYVHKNGWVVTYYSKEEPAAKIVDWNSYEGATITGTKLTNGIAEICNVAGVPTGSPEYYDFRYSGATKLMIVADALFGDGEDTFRLKIPGAFVVYERSWSHYAYAASSSSIVGFDSAMRIDGTAVSYFQYAHVGEAFTKRGELSPVELEPDVLHTICIENDRIKVGKGFDAIVLICREG